MTQRSSRLAGKVAIVTGAAQGIGRTYAEELAKAGAAVAVSDVGLPTATAEAIRSAGGKVIEVVADVTDRASLDRLADATVKAFGRLDILVNNAALFGKLTMQNFAEIPVEEWDRVMAVNVRGTWQSIAAVTPAMKAAGGGKIINISSGTVFKGSPYLLHYVTSKAAVIGLTRSVARELAADKICVNAIAPGLVMSEAVQSHPGWGEVAASIVASRAIKRDSTPDDLIGALLFLASDDANFVTGQTIVVDGGSVMH
ncbi:3-oxoacyl-ACP reductase family protein [Bradyrhizobium sp. dw_78]|uniref:SDR family NAD(P)-dependent oxidoreductase n=1 Tax=Bradyrhizobium sp. dw_78 TaxID=2719793 RepID=UPI001BD3DD42|nr:3-oxoacyl-ACP reductase family protein [Bradyrhizobium sp. dw_78]